MLLSDFKNEAKKMRMGIKPEFGRILSLIDFANVDYWYEKDRLDGDFNELKEGEKLNIDIKKLFDFCHLFSEYFKFYYGLDQRRKKSIHIIKVARDIFGKTNAVTKHIQHIRHYLDESEESGNTRSVIHDANGKYVLIPKCNFDVEICIDAIRLMDRHETLCLFSSDADFISLFRFLKDRGKKLILVKGGFAQTELVKKADLVIQAQDIKSELTLIKQKSRP